MHAFGTRNLAAAAIVALALLPACGGSESSPVCDATADQGALTVNAPGYTCGSVACQAMNTYAFTVAVTGPHTVELVTTSGNANLCSPAVQVSPPGGPGSIICPLNEGSAYDQLVFTAEAGATYQVGVVGALVTGSDPASGASASHAVRVTSP